MNFKIGDRIFVRGYIDEIRKDTVIVRNDGGYFGTIPSEVITGELPFAQPEKRTEERAETHACDLIDREAAVDAIYHHLPSVSRTRARTMLHEVPSAQPEQKWIPCSERLPEKYGNYLISIHGEDEPDIGTINPNDKRGWSLCDANGFHWASDKKLIVTAWMPLPEPYKEEQE